MKKIYKFYRAIKLTIDLAFFGDDKIDFHSAWKAAKIIWL